MLVAVFLAIEVFKSPHNIVHDKLLEKQLFTEYSELEETNKNHQIQPLSEWPMQGSNSHLGITRTML